MNNVIHYTGRDDESNKAIFLDKDGTLIRDIPYNADPSLIRLLPNAGEGLRRLQAAGYVLILISNQSGVAHGYFSEADLAPITSRICTLLAAEGVSLRGAYYCPHAVNGTVEPYACECSCRKPRPGLLLRAARDFNIARAASWMIGDILDDVEAGKRAGCGTILLDNGHETEWRAGEGREPDHRAADLKEAAGVILGEKKIYATAKLL
jgi:D-glycero-D-manno-heptose 1,7-bisphosphate phosphatase